MNKLQTLKIALLIVILAEEIKRANKQKKVLVNLRISNIHEFKEILDNAIKDNDASKLELFKPILNLD